MIFIIQIYKNKRIAYKLRDLKFVSQLIGNDFYKIVLLQIAILPSYKDKPQSQQITWHRLRSFGAFSCHKERLKNYKDIYPEQGIFTKKASPNGNAFTLSYKLLF